MAHNIKAMKVWEAGCVEIRAPLKGKPILLRGGTEHSECVSVIPAVYDRSSPSEPVVFVRKGTTDGIVVRVSNTWEYSLNVDEHYSKSALVISREHWTVSKQVCWRVYGNCWI